MTNGYRRNPYYYGPQARGFYGPYSKHPDWAGGLRDLLGQMATIKQWKEQRKQGGIK